MSDIDAAMREININIGRLYTSLDGLEFSTLWDKDKIIAAKQVLAIVDQLIQMAKEK